MIYEFKQIGNDLLRWGWELNGQTPYDKTKSLDNENRAICLLAAAVQELKNLNLAMYTRTPITPRPPERQDEHPVSDGCLTAMRLLLGDTPVDAMNRTQLSARGRKALLRAKVSVRSEITRERLAGLKNCGEGTIMELLEWAGHEPAKEI